MYVCVHQVEMGVRARVGWGGEGQGKCLDECMNSHSLPKKCKVPQSSREEKGYIWLKKKRAALWSNIWLVSHMTSDHHFHVFSAQFSGGVLIINLFQPFPFLTSAPTWSFFHLQHLADLSLFYQLSSSKTLTVMLLTLCYVGSTLYNQLQTQLPTWWVIPLSISPLQIVPLQ